MTTSRMHVLLLVLALAVPALAEDEKPEVKVATDKEVKLELTVFERDFDTVDIDFKLEALKRLGRCVHQDVVEVLLKILARDPDPYVRAAAAAGLGNQTPFAPKLGRQIVRFLEEDDIDPKVLAEVIRTLGKLQYTRAWEDIADLISHDEDVVVIACFDVIRDWKDLRAWREILLFWEMYPSEATFGTGTVKVDTGAAGTADAEAAKAKWKAKYGGRAKQRPRPECVRAMIAAVKAITEKEIGKAEDFRDWLGENKQKVKNAERRRD